MLRIRAGVASVQSYPTTSAGTTWMVLWKLRVRDDQKTPVRARCEQDQESGGYCEEGGDGGGGRRRCCIVVADTYVDCSLLNGCVRSVSC